MFWTSVRAQPPKCRGFEFRSGFVVHRHDPLSLFLPLIAAKNRQGSRLKQSYLSRWERSQIFPYRDAKNPPGTAGAKAKGAPLPVDSAAHHTRNRQ
jgi:hypothetical protein